MNWLMGLFGLEFGSWLAPGTGNVAMAGLVLFMPFFLVAGIAKHCGRQ